jgi:hypothetical protein
MDSQIMTPNGISGIQQRRRTETINDKLYHMSAKSIKPGGSTCAEGPRYNAKAHLGNFLAM